MGRLFVGYCFVACTLLIMTQIILTCFIGLYLLVKTTTIYLYDVFRIMATDKSEGGNIPVHDMFVPQVRLQI